MRASEFISESTTIVSAEKLWDYVSKIHPKDQQGGGFLKSLVMLNPQYELKRVPLSSLHIPNDEDDGNDPYGRAMHVDVDHAEEYSQYEVDKKPLVVDSQGYILDGAHRAWAASELLNKKDIMAYVPVKTRASTPQDLEIRKKFTNQNVTEGQSVKREIKDFIDSLTPADVGVEEFPGYRIHFEGFTDECKSSSDYQKNPNKVYQQVYQDFIDREGGRKPVKSSMVGDEEYPILYSVFKVPQSKTVDTAEKAYSIAYKKKQPWPRGSREEKLIRSDWQLSGLYDQYVLKQGVAEGKDFDRCFDQACKLYDRAVSKNLEPKLVQVADFQGDGNGADPRWMKLPQHVWQHYVVIVGDQVLDPTAKQFGDSMPTQYKVSDLDRLWGKQYQIRPRQGVAEALTRRDMLKGLAGAAAVGATGAQAGQFIDYDKLIKDPELETVWVPRMQKLQQRCNVMLSKLLRTAGSAWGEQLKGTTVRVESNEQHIQADANERSISVDLTVFWDAPEDVLAFAIGHELGHIALGHNDVPSSPEQSRKDESNADNFAVRLCKALGYNKAGVFKFLYTKKGEIENMNKLTSQPNSTHPTMTQRMDKARQQGFQLSKGGIQQMNTLLTHLA